MSAPHKKRRTALEIGLKRLYNARYVIETDYTLLAAVAVSSGAAQIVSAYPFLLPYRLALAIGLILVIMIVNLRGVKESGTAFAIPTYFFLATTFLTVGVGFARYYTGTLGTVVDPPAITLELR